MPQTRPRPLPAACDRHHDRKSSQRNRIRLAIKEKRKPEEHPGPWMGAATGEPRERATSRVLQVAHLNTLSAATQNFDH